jgi:RNA polymerase sigma-70 factor (ECF subfamily)
MPQPVRDFHVSVPSADAMLVELVERARVGDQTAFAALFERYNDRICTYLARQIGDDDLGRDLAQDTFLAAWRALPEMRDAPRFAAWLYRIATNIARSYRRRAYLVRWLPWVERFDRDATHDATSDPSAPGPEEHAGEAERVKLALAQLGPQNRTCLLLQLEGGFTQAEIADLLGISAKSVSAYVSRGRERL